MKSNRSAIGAPRDGALWRESQAQEVLSQSSFYSANDPRLHFGLGPAQTADLEIRWPNGDRRRIAKVAADQLVVIKEGVGIVRRDPLRRR